METRATKGNESVWPLLAEARDKKNRGTYTTAESFQKH